MPPKVASPKLEIRPANLFNHISPYLRPMQFRYFAPSLVLRPYIRHYYSFVSDEGAGFEDTVFPSGDMEVIFNLGAGTWETAADNRFIKTPQVELWGQVTKPLAVRSTGKHTMLGIRFLTHSASYFFDEEIGLFNDHVTNLCDVMGNAATQLHAQLMEAPVAEERIQLVANFLLQRLAANEKKAYYINKVADILTSIQRDADENNIGSIASTHNITPRYLHKLIYKHTGLSPKSFTKISRFQQSLKLISKNKRGLTSIAYDCGYFDQSHFIRDFKSFTGVTPSAYLENNFPVTQVFMQ